MTLGARHRSLRRVVDVLYEDEFLLVVCKPSGALAHRGIGVDGPFVVDLLRAQGERDPRPVHRLDRGTSGALVVARHFDAARALSGAFEAGTVRKVYLALVRGTPPLEGLIDHPVPSGPRERGVIAPRVPAKTKFRTVASVDIDPRTVSLVLAQPLTGRFHQIRRHLKHLDHPVIGDSTHGKGPLNRRFRELYALSRIALHALELRFPHPMFDREIVVRAPVPADLCAPLTKMGFAESQWMCTF
ncbi:MAG: RluA family pseudouridine synthase [Deltaproteobacteria bacterium]|nr:RluA family pseudouridine synthase [Deltaproteobacteria bacterium]